MDGKMDPEIDLSVIEAIANYKVGDHVLTEHVVAALAREILRLRAEIESMQKTLNATASDASYAKMMTTPIG